MHPRKPWHTVSEDTLQRASAGWVWLHTFMDGRGESLPIDTRIGDALMSKLVPPCVILRHNVDGGPGTVIASMGNRIWAALGLPLQETEIDGVAHFSFDLRGAMVSHRGSRAVGCPTFRRLERRSAGGRHENSRLASVASKALLAEQKLMPVDDPRFAEAHWTFAVGTTVGGATWFHGNG